MALSTAPLRSLFSSRPLRSRWLALALFAALVVITVPASAQVPGLLNYQGKVSVSGVPFSGNGRFKFALVDGAGATTYWSNDGTSAAGSEPSAAVTLTVVRGIYAVQLGDTTLPNMATPVPMGAFANGDVRLRVWFDDGVHGFQLLSPDQRLASVGYAMSAATLSESGLAKVEESASAAAKSAVAEAVAAAVDQTAQAKTAQAAAEKALATAQAADTASQLQAANTQVAQLQQTVSDLTAKLADTQKTLQAQIADLNNKVDSLTKDGAAKDATITDLNNQLATSVAMVAAKDTQISDLNAQIVKLQSEIDDLKAQLANPGP